MRNIELKKLFNDNRKLYFKGTSHFISLNLVKPKKKNLHKSSDDSPDQDITVIYTDKNKYFKKGTNLIKDENKDKKIEKVK